MSSPQLIAVAVVELAGKFLVGVRPPRSALAGYSEFPGGKIHERETPAAAAARECWEETGLRVEIGPLLASPELAYAHGLLKLYFFAATPIEPVPAPRPPFRWVAREDLATLRFPPANADVLTQLAGSAPHGPAGDQKATGGNQTTK